jgi:anaerobic magnesium-protoporphyrin IX monomethyl ester cyclase
MKVLLVNPPRHYWPFINEGDNYLLPQALPCLGASLRENDIEVKLVDCLPLKMGWKTLEKLLEKEKPDVLGVCTSETMFIHESVRACKLMKRIDKGTVTVVGGHHFSAVPEESLKDHKCIDYIVIGEGEITFPELVKALEKGKDMKKVKGIAFRKGGKPVMTEPRPLIKDLDDLPMPAYDLLPMDKYIDSRLLWSQGGTTMLHSRGCVDNCDFCACWVHMANRKMEKGKLRCTQSWRTKSVQRALDEAELLNKKYKKHFIVFGDNTWNVDPKWGARFSEGIMERDLDFKWFAFLRADFLVRDEKMGVLKKMVDAGMAHVCIGVERAVNSELKLLNKSYSGDVVEKSFRILKEKYPQVFRQGTFIFGFRNETKESMRNLFDYARKLDLDYPGFHPITPVPGTKTWDEAKRKGWLEIKDYNSYDWVTPIMRSDAMSREEIDQEMVKLYWEYMTFPKILKGLFSKHSQRRNMHMWCLLVAAKVSMSGMKDRLMIRDSSKTLGMVKPKWYDT